MNVLYLANAGLAGFLVSLMMLECFRHILRDHWPVQATGFQLELRVLPWVIALLAGPALLWDQSMPFRNRTAGTMADFALVMLLVAAWSASYGISLGWAMQKIL